MKYLRYSIWGKDTPIYDGLKPIPALLLPPIEHLLRYSVFHDAVLWAMGNAVQDAISHPAHASHPS